MQRVINYSINFNLFCFPCWIINFNLMATHAMAHPVAREGISISFVVVLKSRQLAEATSYTL